MARRRPVVLSRDHARLRTPPAPTSEAIDAHLTELIQPAVFAQQDAYRRLVCGSGSWRCRRRWRLS